MRKSNWIVLAFVALCAFIVWLQLGRRSGPAPPGPAPRSTQGGTTGAMPPAGDAVTINFSSSDGKKEWVDAVTERFHQSGAAVNGKPVRVVVNATELTTLGCGSILASSASTSSRGTPIRDAAISTCSSRRSDKSRAAASASATVGGSWRTRRGPYLVFQAGLELLLIDPTRLDCSR